MINIKKNNDELQRRFVATDHLGGIGIAMAGMPYRITYLDDNKIIIYQLIKNLFAGN